MFLLFYQICKASFCTFHDVIIARYEDCVKGKCIQNEALLFVEIAQNEDYSYKAIDSSFILCYSKKKGVNQLNIENLKQARKASGMTQKEVADKIGVGQSTYKNYECGFREPNGDTMVQLANLFGVTTDYLLGREVASAEELNPILQLTQAEMEQQLLEAYFSLPQKLRDDFIKGMADELERRKTIQPKRHTHEATIGELQDAAAAEAEAKKDAG